MTRVLVVAASVGILFGATEGLLAPLLVVPPYVGQVVLWVVVGFVEWLSLRELLPRWQQWFGPTVLGTAGGLVIWLAVAPLWSALLPPPRSEVSGALALLGGILGIFLSIGIGIGLARSAGLGQSGTTTESRATIVLSTVAGCMVASLVVVLFADLTDADDPGHPDSSIARALVWAVIGAAGGATYAAISALSIVHLQATRSREGTTEGQSER